MKRRTILKATAALAAMKFSWAHAQAYPNQMVKIVVPYSPGGSADFLSRKVAERLTARWNQTVMVENKAGGGTVTASNYVRRAKPDGYTIMLATIVHAVLPATRRNLPFDPLEDFDMIAQAIAYPFLLVSRSTLPVNTLGELVAYAKANEGKLTYGSTGIGSTVHLTGELFNKEFGIKTVHVPYKGAAQITTALLSGEIDFTFDLLITPLAHIKTKRLKALAVTSPKRMPQVPDVPTFTELNRPALELMPWMGFVAPRGLPPDILKQISESVIESMNEMELKAQLERDAIMVETRGPAEFRAYVAKEIRRYKQVVADAGIEALD
jgi:tripartite-type tricarboxylate transporter receptor subunit TctC